jgi:hypothetical protein
VDERRSKTRTDRPCALHAGRVSWSRRAGIGARTTTGERNERDERDGRARQTTTGEREKMGQLKPGSRLRSSVCSTEVMVVMAPSGDVDLTCGGAPMADLAGAPEPTGSPQADLAGGTQMGKRYVNEAGDLELLCTKPGAGTLAVGTTALGLKGAKPLPSSD